MGVITVFIENDASITFLKSPLTAGFNLGPTVTRRASHVQPNNAALRLVFHLLRLVFGDTGAVAANTREWPCLWQADMRPIGGPVLQGRWYNRQEAIDAEIAWFTKNGVICVQRDWQERLRSFGQTWKGRLKGIGSGKAKDASAV